MDLQTLLNKAEPKLKEVHPKIAEMGRELIKRSYQAGVKIIITQGLRTIAYQNQLYAQGRSTPGKIVTNVKGGYSYHNYGLALDFAVVSHDGRTVHWDTSIDLDKDKHPDWFEVGQIAEQIGLSWGGRWKNFVDIPHVEYTFGLSIAELRAGKQIPKYVPTPPKQITVTTKEVDGMTKLHLEHQWQWDMLANQIKFFLDKGLLNGDVWLEKAKNKNVTLDEITFLNNVILWRSLGGK